VAAGSDFKRPESVLVVVYTRERECLLLERAQPAGFWQSVTGSLRCGETPAECAARELAEETGLEAAGLRDTGVVREFPILPAWRARYAPDVATNREHLWHLEIPARQPVRLRADEHVAYEWLPFERAIEKVSSWTNREALERLALRFPPSS
jgi:dihydroneopterin triphosphate diphosphatase